MEYTRPREDEAMVKTNFGSLTFPGYVDEAAIVSSSIQKGL